MFQQKVNLTQSLGVVGDFASANPRASEVAGPGALVAGPNGCKVGLFAWISGNQVNNTGAGAPDGFIGRAQQALMMTFNSQYGMTIPAGMPVTVFNAGDFLCRNDGTAATARRLAVYADLGDGKASSGASNAPASAAFTGSIAANIAASTCSITANTFLTSTISGTTMTVGSIGAGAVFPGQILTGTNVSAGTTVIAQLTGATVGGAGTYQVSISQTVLSTTITGSGGCFTVVTMTSGTIVVGQTLSGGATDAATTVLAFGTGAGAAGNYWVSVSQAISAQAITASGGTLTVTAIASGTLLPNDIIYAASNITTGNYIVQGITGTGGTGTYLVSVGDTFSSGAITIAGSVVATNWNWASVVNPGEVGKISTWTV